jgi:hypothetical protein
MYDDSRLQRAFGAFWAAVARAVLSEPNVIAFELVNEPWYGDVKLEHGPKGVGGWQLGQPAAASAPSLMRLHAALHTAVRSVDNRTVLLFEPGAGGAAYFEPTNYTAGPGGAAYDDRQAFAYHQYCPESIDGREWGEATPLPSPAEAAARIARCQLSTRSMVELRTADAASACEGGAALVTEFGQVNNDTVGIAALEAATAAFERAGQGWTIWSVQLMNWLQVGGVPGYHPEPRAPPDNWLRPLARTYAAAVPGHVLTETFLPMTGSYTLRFTAAHDARVRQLPCVMRYSGMLHYPAGLAFDVEPISAGTLQLKPWLKLGGEMQMDSPLELIMTPSSRLLPGQVVVVRVWARDM